jgi:hypothetical protein
MQMIWHLLSCGSFKVQTFFSSINYKLFFFFFFIYIIKWKGMDLNLDISKGDQDLINYNY